MASMYAKLMGRITESSLMEEPIIVRYCFMMLLAVADPQGYAIGTDVALARRLNMPLDEFRECIVDLMRPDPHSNSKEHEGRRIIESDGERGYWIVNYVKYRDTRDEEQRREYMRVYMQNHRAKKAVAESVKPRKQRKLSLAKEEVEEEAEGKVKAKEERVELPSALGETFGAKWLEYIGFRRRMKFKALLPESEMGQLARLAKFGPEVAAQAIDQTIANGWQGLFPEKIKPAQNGHLDKSKTIRLTQAEMPPIWRP